MYLEVRPACEEDAAAICRVHQSSVETWFRFPCQGPPVAADYEELDDVERWRNGGPWVVPSLCRAHLAWHLGRGGYAWVALLDGEIVGEAEAFVNQEPPPLGRYLNLSVLYVHRQAQRWGVGRLLLEEGQALAARQACDAVLIGDVEPEAEAFYARCGFSPWQGMRLGRVPCSGGQAIGRPFEPGDYAQVAGLPMPVGRYQGARQEWERMRGPASLPGSLGPWRRDWRVWEVAEEPVWVAFAGSPFVPARVILRAWTRASPEDLLSALLAEAGALGYAQADFLLEETVFLQLQEYHGLVEAGRQQAWWCQRR